MDGKQFTGNELVESLKAGALGAAQASLVGIVKSSDQYGHIAFSRSGCEDWVDLPAALIATAEQLGHQQCRGHSHPLMRLHLAPAKSPEAQALASLLSQQPDEQGMTPPGYGDGPGGATNWPMDGSMMRPPDEDAYGFGSSGAGAAAMMAGPVGGPGDIGGFGGLSAWGCWKSTCIRCTAYRWVRDPTGRSYRVCTAWYEYPCERCIWPY